MYTPVKSPKMQEPDPLGLANEIEAGQLMNVETDDCIGAFAATETRAPVEAAAITNAATRVDARGDMDFKLPDLCISSPLKTVREPKSVFCRAFARFKKNKEKGQEDSQESFLTKIASSRTKVIAARTATTST